MEYYYVFVFHILIMLRARKTFQLFNVHNNRKLQQQLRQHSGDRECNDTCCIILLK